jgi:Tfp pilus assembly protein PilE
MVAIIGLLSGIAVPIYSDFADSARVSTAKGIIRESK